MLRHLPDRKGRAKYRLQIEYSDRFTLRVPAQSSVKLLEQMRCHMKHEIHGHMMLKFDFQ